DPAIVEMLAISGNMGAKCTATLISPHILLTAAHCIAETQGSTYLVFPGNDDSRISKSNVLAVRTAVFDPGFGKPQNGHDIAVVVLVDALPQKPIPINRASLDPWVGKPARYVGYGLTNGVNQTGSGVKREN